jgi:hypothetical protein
LTGNGKFVWGRHHQEAFEKMKGMIATEAMLHYLDHSLPFEIYTNASDYQLIIMQIRNQ